MDMTEVKAFNSELSGLYDNKPPISKAKMSAITKGAIKAIKFYKHVVHSVEKFIQKCKPEYKVPGLYVIDSIVRQSRHQFGQDKDVFAPRFAKNMQQTFANLFRCPPEDKRNIIRVLNLWQKNNVFSSDVIQPLLDMADPNHPLHQEIQQSNNANGSTLNVSHSSDNKTTPMQQHTPQGPSPMGDAFQDQSSNPPPSGGKFNRKLINDFEYDSDEDTGAADPPPQPPNPADALGSILTNPEIMRQLQSLQAQMQLMTGMQLPSVMPNLVADIQMQQNQNQQLPFLGGHQPESKSENKEEGTNESDIEFVETGPQVIEIPDANDSRSPSPRRRRSRSPRRSRRRSSRSRSPRRRRGDRDRDRDRDRERDRDNKDREKSYKEREADKEKQREREKKGLPPIKKENLSVCSTTLWVGHLSKLATPEELSDLFGSIGGVVSIDVVGPRGCAFVVMERRRDAAKALEKLNKHKLHSKEITVAWAPGKGVKDRSWKDYWEGEHGVSYLPWDRLQQLWTLGLLSVDALEEGGAVDEDTLPPWLPQRIIPKAFEGQLGMIPGLGPGQPGLLHNLPPGAIPSLPPGLPGNIQLPGAPPPGLPLGVPRIPPPGITGGIPGGIAPGMPPGIRPPNLPGGVPGLPTDGSVPPAGALLGFPGGLPPQSLAQPGMVGGFLGGLMGLGGLLPLHLARPAAPHAMHQPNHVTTEVTRTDDAMDLDTEENQTNEASNDGNTDSNSGPVLPEQLAALLSKPPPNFNASEPPPNFKPSEPTFNSSIPPPTDDRNDDDKKDRRDRDRNDRDRDRNRDRRDRDRDRNRDRERDRRDRPERDDRRDRDRERGDRDRDRNDRDRRDRDRDRNRFSRDNNRERSREKSQPTNNQEPTGEKSLQERLWEMANGKPGNRDADKADQSQARDFPDAQRDGPNEEGRPPMGMRHEHPPPLLDVPGLDKSQDNDGGWTQLPPPRQAPPQMPPNFRAELRMRGPPRPPMRGPWMDPNFRPPFNGMGPPPFNRPPFERPPFEGPMFDGPPRFDCPPFNRMPFDGPRPFDGPIFDGPFDRNRRFDDQFNDRGWNGERREWDDRRRDRRPERREDERFNRNDRERRRFDERRPGRDDRTPQKDERPARDDRTPQKDERPPKDGEDKVEEKREEKPERNTRRERDRKSRWGAVDESEVAENSENRETQESSQSTDDAFKETESISQESNSYQESDKMETKETYVPPTNENVETPYEEPKEVDVPKYDAPQEKYDEAPQTYEEPKQSYEEPQEKLDEPQKEYDEPQQQYDEPQERHDKPQESYEAPQEKYDAPQERYDEPQERQDEPQERYDEPQERYEEPQRHEDPPQPVEQYNDEAYSKEPEIESQQNDKIESGGLYDDSVAMDTSFQPEMLNNVEESTENQAESNP